MTTTDTSHRSMTPAEAGQVFVTPQAFADMDLFHAAAATLREREPIHLVEHKDYPPFYVLTKHADVWEVEHHHEIWRNAPNSILADKVTGEIQQRQGEMLRTLVNMDGPDHKAYRKLTADWFSPRNLAKLEIELARLARKSVDHMAELGNECDFAQDIAVWYPLQVILSLLGLPESDYPFMLKLTQEIFGAQDPELARGNTPEELFTVLIDFLQYFGALIEDRKANPTDDLSSVIANATFDGKPMPPLDQASYYVILATAGHDTTSSSMAGGLQALIENPDQLERLRDNPSLMMTAADEIIRWVTPVRHFMRNAVGPYTLREHNFETGDAVLLSYPSANRDEEAFADPFRFDVGRNPNRHLAFGTGVHYCLGAMLARMEIKALFSELVPRLRSVELAGTPELSSGYFVGGLKRLPIRYEVASATG
jgi:cytochrome P450